jgi:cation diffusion facilitator family transporter
MTASRPDLQPRLADATSRLALANVAVAMLVMAIKYAAYLATGSVALYSDALESLVNVATAIAALIAIRISRQPADRNHPFGHHKVEYFSAVLEGALVIVAALLIFNEALRALAAPRAIEAPWLGVAISGCALLINAAWASLLIRSGTARRSPALVADGWHLVTDVITTLGVILGIGLAVVTGWAILDPLIGAALAVHILFVGARLARESLSSLMDEAVDSRTLDGIHKAIAAHADGAIEVHDLRTRVAASKTFIEFHLVVPAAMTVAAAHDICDRLEAALMERVPESDVLIHVEPEGEARIGRGGPFVD